MLKSVEPEGKELRRFLIESERRVIWHCQKMLARQGLSFADRRRLTSVLGKAESELQRLDPARGLHGI